MAVCFDRGERGGNLQGLHTPPTSEIMTRREAAQYMRTSVRYLEDLAREGGGPIFAKLGAGRRAPVRYRRADVDAWIARNLVTNTSDVKRGEAWKNNHLATACQEG